MNTLDFEALQRFTRQAQKLQTVAREIMPFIEAINALDGKDFIPLDRLIRAGEAAQMLGVNTSTISEFVKTGLLTPLYVNSDQRRLSQPIGTDCSEERAESCSGSINQPLEHFQPPFTGNYNTVRGEFVGGNVGVCNDIGDFHAR